VQWIESNATPDKLQGLESRQYQALELARVANVPPYLVGVEVGSMVYQSSAQARQDLYLFGAKPYVDCISETLSGDNVVAKGKHIVLDVDSYISEAGLEGDSRSLSAAEVAQKVYLAVANGVMSVDEARTMISDAGAKLNTGV
jgi:phage portal protein BeeE